MHLLRQRQQFLVSLEVNYISLLNDNEVGALQVAADIIERVQVQQVYSDVLYSDESARAQLMPQWLLNKALLAFDSAGVATQFQYAYASFGDINKYATRVVDAHQGLLFSRRARCFTAEHEVFQDVRQPYAFAPEAQPRFSLEVREDGESVGASCVHELEKLNVLQQTILFQKDFVPPTECGNTLFAQLLLAEQGEVYLRALQKQSNLADFYAGLRVKMRQNSLSLSISHQSWDFCTYMRLAYARQCQERVKASAAGARGPDLQQLTNRSLQLYLRQLNCAEAYAEALRQQIRLVQQECDIVGIRELTPLQFVSVLLE